MIYIIESECLRCVKLMKKYGLFDNMKKAYEM